MKLLHLVHTPRHSGAEILVRDLCLRHVENGVDCAIAAFETGTPEFQVELEKLRAAGVQIFIPASGVSRLGRLATYIRAIRAFRPHAIFGHSLLPAAYGRAALIASGSRAKFFKVLHSGSDDYASAHIRWIESLLRLRTDAVITVTSAAANFYIHRFGTSLPIVMISNGVNLDDVRTKRNFRNEIRAKFGLSDNDRLFLQVGRIVPIKNQRLSLAALAPLVAVDVRLRLWFVGIPEDRAYVDALELDIDALNLPGRIQNLGTRTDVPSLLAAADVFLMPSEVEAQGIAFLEAMASGPPIIASDIPAFEFARGMDGVALINPNDLDAFRQAAKIAINDTARYQYELGAYDVRTTAQAYETILSQDFDAGRSTAF
jgi:glycosyltransferase involved in cell wall biosynthesis